jgi:hypothetical protein
LSNARRPAESAVGQRWDQQALQNLGNR